MCVRHSTKKMRAAWAQKYWAAPPKAQQTIIELSQHADENTVRLRAAQHIEERTVGPVAHQITVDGQMEHTLWGGNFEGFNWITESKDEDESDDRRELEDVVEGEIVEDDPLRPLAPDDLGDDDPWGNHNGEEEQRARLRGYIREAAAQR